MDFDLNSTVTYILNSLPRGGQHREIAHSCNVPWKHVTVDLNGDVLLCECDAWLPLSIGKVEDFSSLPAVWDSNRARSLQQDITDKKYTWCAVDSCGVVQHDVVRYQHSLHINLDQSCNLSCPSCRRQQIMLDSGPEFEIKSQRLQTVMSWLEKFDQPIHITLSGNGDPLASKIIRPLIQDYKPMFGQTFNIKTNGLLLKKLLPGNALKDAIVKYSISVDAGSKAVYEKVRRPGRWEVLMENLQWLSLNRNRASVIVDFVVQRDNLQDMPAFVDLCAKFGFIAHFSKLVDWGTWSSTVNTPDSYTIVNGTFLDHDVANLTHKDHGNFVTMVNEIKSKNLPYVLFDNSFTKFFNVTR